MFKFISEGYHGSIEYPYQILNRLSFPNRNIDAKTQACGGGPSLRRLAKKSPTYCTGLSRCLVAKPPTPPTSSASQSPSVWTHKPSPGSGVGSATLGDSTRRQSRTIPISSMFLLPPPTIEVIIGLVSSGEVQVSATNSRGNQHLHCSLCAGSEMR
jgi:hypothetical protein